MPMFELSDLPKHVDPIPAPANETFKEKKKA
jgi:hypothetical protein